ncbi:MAG: metallophosphoesterase [Nitrososphaeraceae archaeon]|nr:metallophosphoesterase [Nitrososphaeraceae archaeon]MDW0268789.1 metallophosphoesterase [Nitrososphaeraceae archaeon]
MIQIQNTHAKLFLSVFSLLLLVIVTVTYTPASFQKVLAASDTTMAAAGDWGCSDNTEKTVQNVRNLNPKLLLALGDFSYDKTSTCWLSVMKPIESITKISIGNHEDSDTLLNSYLNQFRLSKQYYSFDTNNVHVLIMSTEEESEPNSDQYNFAVNDLRNAANNPDIKWIVVNMHNPFYSSPNECKASGCEGDKDFRESFHPLFDKYGVDLVLEGHVHNYQRSFPLAFNQQKSGEPIVTSASKTDYNNPSGAIFAIVGTGGVNLHGLSDKAPFMAFQQDSKFGVLYIHFSDDKIDAKFVTNEGETLDHFSISKTAKKKIIERISDNIPSDTKTEVVSYKDEAKAKPVIEKDQNGKPAITFKLDEGAAAVSDKTEPKTDEVVVKDKTEPKTDEVVVKDKTEPKTDELKVQEDKPAITSKLSNDSPKEDKSMLISDEQIEQADNNNKPAMTTKLSNDPPTDDKQISQNGQDKSESSDQGKPTNTNSAVGGISQHIGNTDQSDNDEFVDTDTDTGTNINTNEKDPFSSLN